jgi:hypothetical protein
MPPMRSEGLGNNMLSEKAKRSLKDIQVHTYAGEIKPIVERFHR